MLDSQVVGSGADAWHPSGRKSLNFGFISFENGSGFMVYLLLITKIIHTSCKQLRHTENCEESIVEYSDNSLMKNYYLTSTHYVPGTEL